MSARAALSTLNCSSLHSNINFTISTLPDVLFPYVIRFSFFFHPPPFRPRGAQQQAKWAWAWTRVYALINGAKLSKFNVVDVILAANWLFSLSHSSLSCESSFADSMTIRKKLIACATMDTFDPLVGRNAAELAFDPRPKLLPWYFSFSSSNFSSFHFLLSAHFALHWRKLWTKFDYSQSSSLRSDTNLNN